MVFFFCCLCLVGGGGGVVLFAPPPPPPPGGGGGERGGGGGGGGRSMLEADDWLEKNDHKATLSHSPGKLLSDTSSNSPQEVTAGADERSRRNANAEWWF